MKSRLCEWFISLWCIFVLGSHAFIFIPEEIPSILSIFFSNVPQVKKGTDSRVGIGFRLGPNVDYQLQFEIGPQLNTQPIGPLPDNSTAARKRQNPISKTSISQQNKFEVDMQMKNDSDHDDTETFLAPRQISDPTKKNTESANLLRQLYELANNNSLT